MLGLDVYRGSQTELTAFRTVTGITFPLLRNAGSPFSREDLIVVDSDGVVRFSQNSLGSSTVRSNAIAKVDELLAPPPSAPAISVQQTAVDFGTVAFAQSVQQTITITNTGTADLEITDIQSDVSGLTFDTTTFTLSPNGSQTVTITFPSSTEGTFSGLITISSNDPDRATQILSVSVTVQPQPVPVLDVQETAVNFGTVEVAQSVQQTITITNTGTADLEITGIESDVSGLTFDTTTFTLAPNGSQIVTITFPSSTEGAFSGLITISSNDPDRAKFMLTISGVVQPLSVEAKSDFDGDGVVGILDFLLFVEAFGSTNSKFDIDGDGVVGILDFLLFVEAFGKRVDG